LEVQKTAFFCIHRNDSTREQWPLLECELPHRLDCRLLSQTPALRMRGIKERDKQLRGAHGSGLNSEDEIDPFMQV
jgi:hypothetical protein